MLVEHYLSILVGRALALPYYSMYRTILVTHVTEIAIRSKHGISSIGGLGVMLFEYEIGFFLIIYTHVFQSIYLVIVASSLVSITLELLQHFVFRY